jgi:hypothetical protein
MTHRDTRMHRMVLRSTPALLWWQYQRGTVRTYYVFRVPIWRVGRWHDYPLQCLLRSAASAPLAKS